MKYQQCSSAVAPLFTSIPVRIFLKASSTFVESKAEVSMNDRLFFSEGKKRKHGRRIFNSNGSRIVAAAQATGQDRSQ